MIIENKQKIIQDFDVLSEQVHRMLNLLNNEAVLIKSKDIAGIETIASEKQTLSTKLNSWVSQQQNILFRSENPNQRDVSEHSAEPNINFLLDPNLADRWNHIKSLLTQCKLLNETNGACIELIKRHSQRSLEVLYNSGSAPQIYGPNGVTEASLPSRSLTLA